VIISVLIILLVQPVCKANAGMATSKVELVADSEYEFTLPQDTELPYPQAAAKIGDFIVGDLFLGSYEELAIQLKTGEFVSEGEPYALPYTVEFSPPGRINADNIGEAYEVNVKLDKEALRLAPAGRYRAEILFRVVSYPENKVVWQGTTTISIEKSANSLFNGSFWMSVSVSVIIVCALFMIISIRRKRREGSLE
jgi:hypothetical protein